MGQAYTHFSIVVPTYNRPRQLTACLKALARLDYPRDRFEVIVVDDGGDTPLNDLLARFREMIEVTLLRQSHGGPASARNNGAAKARGRFLAFTDDDCSPAPDWLRTLEATFAAADDPVIVGGRVLNALADNIFATASQLIVEVGCIHHNSDPERARFCTANNFALATEQFRAVGGFEGEFKIAASEDREFCGRWLHRGYRIIYAPEVLVHHAHELTWRTFWQQHFTYGRGAHQLQRIRAREGWQLFKPNPGYYVDLIFHPFGEAISWHSLLISALLFLSQSVSAAGIVVEWIQNRRDKSAYPVDV
jgi:glycosyltransferase involved in cell wall biosynthesis